MGGAGRGRPALTIPARHFKNKKKKKNMHWKWPFKALNPRRGIALGPPVVGAALHWLHSLRLPLLFTIIFHHSDWAGYNPDPDTWQWWGTSRLCISSVSISILDYACLKTLMYSISEHTIGPVHICSRYTTPAKCSRNKFSVHEHSYCEHCEMFSVPLRSDL